VLAARQKGDTVNAAFHPGGVGMIASLALRLADLEQRVAMIQLSLQGLRATYATDATARADFDAVAHHTSTLRSQLAGVRIECKYSKGGR
jgi:hypothetical protein